jgi:hypothetical protein
MAIRTKQIIKGSATLFNGSNGIQSSVLPNVASLGKAKLEFTYRTVGAGSNTDPENALVRGFFLGVGDIRFERVSTSGEILIDWTVIEYTSGSNINVQHLNLTNVSPGQNIAINNVGAVDQAYAIATIENTGITAGNDDFLFPQITSPTNLQIRMAAGSVSDLSLQVISSPDLLVQQVDTGSVSGTPNQAFFGTPIDTTRTTIKPYSENTGNYAAFKWMGTAELAANNRVDFWWGDGSLIHRGWAYVIQWPVNFKARWQFTPNTTADSANVNINGGALLDVNRAYVISNGCSNFSNGRSSTEGADNWSVIASTWFIQNTTTLLWVRGNGFNNNFTNLSTVLEDTGPNVDPVTGGVRANINGGLIENGLINKGLIR